MVSLMDAFAWKYKGYIWRCGDTYESLDWQDEAPKPTEEEVNQALTEYEAYFQTIAHVAPREVDYDLEGITPQKMIIALWEKVMEERPEAADALQVKRLEIKQKHPKQV